MNDDPARRWRRLVRARRAQMHRLAPDDWPAGAALWDRRAEQYAERVAGSATRDPFLRQVRRVVGRRTVVIDVGAGSGRFALALAPHVREVVAVDPSKGMLDVLQRQADRDGIDNIRVVHASWEDVHDLTGDVVVCSYVLPVVEDAVAFLRNLDRAARRHALLYLGAASPDLLLDPLWRWFHGQPREPGPTYLDAVAVVRMLGIDPHVRIVEVPARNRFADLEAAVDDYRRTLCVHDSAEARQELRGLLHDWLVRDRDGLRAPVRTFPAAVVRWVPRGPAAGELP